MRKIKHDRMVTSSCSSQYTTSQKQALEFLRNWSEEQSALFERAGFFVSEEINIESGELYIKPKDQNRNTIRAGLIEATSDDTLWVMHRREMNRPLPEAIFEGTEREVHTFLESWTYEIGPPSFKYTENEIYTVQFSVSRDIILSLDQMGDEVEGD